jgi:hypothetical protein
MREQPSHRPASETRFSIGQSDSEPRLPVQQPETRFSIGQTNSEFSNQNLNSESRPKMKTDHLLNNVSAAAINAADGTRFRIRHQGDGLGPPATNRPKAPVSVSETLPTRWRRQVRVLGEVNPKRGRSTPIGIGHVGRKPQSPMGPRGQG